jgi:hypothetical protein
MLGKGDPRPRAGCGCEPNRRPARAQTGLRHLPESGFYAAAKHS